MEKLIRKTKKFLLDQEGVTAVEYAVILAVIIGVCAAGYQLVGKTTNDQNLALAQKCFDM